MSRTTHGAALAIALVACGGGHAAGEGGYGRSHVEREPQALDVALRDARGDEFTLDQFRGHRVLLFLFATFDLASQAALGPVREVANDDSDLVVVGVALQPDPRDLLPIFATTLDVRFPLVYEAEPRLLRGLTDVGPIASVPTYVLLDEHGVLMRHHTGGLTATALREWSTE